jgi:hypothetical protein
MRPIILANRLFVIGILSLPICLVIPGFVWLWAMLLLVYFVAIFVALLDLLWNGL